MRTTTPIEEMVAFERLEGPGVLRLLRQCVYFVYLALIFAGQSQIQRNCHNAEDDEGTHNCGQAPCKLRMRHCEANAEQNVTGNHDYQARPETWPTVKVALSLEFCSVKGTASRRLSF